MLPIDKIHHKLQKLKVIQSKLWEETTVNDVWTI